MNPYIDYYVNQAGSGLRGFSGTRYQRGYGWFSRLFSSAILPALKFLGKKSLSAGINVADDVLAGKNVKESLKTRAIEGGKETAKAAIDRGNKFLQTGKGKRSKNKKRCKRQKISFF